MKSNEDGEIEHVIEIKEYKVFHRIYLSLQEDEVELAKPLFLESCLMTYSTFLSTE
jgi:DNA primase